MQSEIIDYLKKVKTPKGVSEIAIALKQDKIKVSKALRQLLKFHEVFAFEIDRLQAMDLYHCKRRMKLYYMKK